MFVCSIVKYCRDRIEDHVIVPIQMTLEIMAYFRDSFHDPEDVF